MIFLIYYGFQQMLNTCTEFAGSDIYSISPFWAGVLAIGFIYGAYLKETFRGAYLVLPSGQSEAVMSLGISPITRVRKVILP